MKAYEILNSPEKWTKGTHFKNVEGVVLAPESAKATCMCLEGAVILAYSYTIIELYRSWEYRRLEIAIEAKYGLTRLHANKCNLVASFNDHPETTFEEVVALLKELDL